MQESGAQTTLAGYEKVKNEPKRAVGRSQPLRSWSVEGSAFAANGRGKYGEAGGRTDRYQRAKVGVHNAGSAEGKRNNLARRTVSANIK